MSQMHPTMNASEVEFSDLVHRRRLQVLQSVDDLVEAVVEELDAAHALEDTVILYTSDHGYHMGQFAMVYDKRTPYEHDVRIPYMVRLPKNLIAAETLVRLRGSHSAAIVSNVDVAPSLAALGGASSHSGWDGQSWAGLLGLEGPQTDQPWRTVQLIEYWGQNSHPTLSPGLHDTPPHFTGHAFSWYQDDVTNTWACIRSPLQPNMLGGDSIFCQWFESWDAKANATADGGWSFEEYYNIAKDPYQLTNLLAGPTPAFSGGFLVALRGNLTALRKCRGASECSSITMPVWPTE